MLTHKQIEKAKAWRDTNLLKDQFHSEKIWTILTDSEKRHLLKLSGYSDKHHILEFKDLTPELKAMVTYVF